MAEPAALQRNGHWRTAVWALRCGGVGLAVTLLGVVALSAGRTAWILAAGVIVWLAAATVTLTGFLLARSDLPEPRPGLWSMRLMLIYDTVHRRAWTAAPAGEG
jgi:hypothetical protein